MFLDKIVEGAFSALRAILSTVIGYTIIDRGNVCAFFLVTQKEQFPALYALIILCVFSTIFDRWYGIINTSSV